MTGDDEVVAAAKQGDADAWRELYRAHAPRLLVWLQGRWSGEESPEDIASAAWLVAAEKIATFHGDQEEFAGWLFGIARHHSVNVRRRAARRGAVGGEPDRPASDPGPESATSGGDWARRLLATLPERERDVVTCREVFDMDVSTTAGALGISAVAVRVAHHRALKRLRSEVTAQGAAESRAESRADKKSPGPT